MVEVRGEVTVQQETVPRLDWRSLSSLLLLKISSEIQNIQKLQTTFSN